MAGCDYIDCNECGKRLLYNGSQRISDPIIGQGVTCDICVKRMKKKIFKLEKELRKKR